MKLKEKIQPQGGTFLLLRKAGGWQQSIGGVGCVACKCSQCLRFSFCCTEASFDVRNPRGGQKCLRKVLNAEYFQMFCFKFAIFLGTPLNTRQDFVLSGLQPTTWLRHGPYQAYRGQHFLLWKAHQWTRSVQLHRLRSVQLHRVVWSICLWNLWNTAESPSGICSTQRPPPPTRQ